jgi:predicted Zn-dependent protease
MKKIIVLVAVLLSAMSCDENNNFVLFSVQNDVELGQQVKTEIQSDPQYKILSSQQYPEVYSYLYSMRDEILASGEIAYKDEFAWELYVINDDKTLNAFATPGGYIYIYTGLIKYLDNADDLAGVLGHEMAHADQRHTVRNLQKMYGVQILLSVALGQDPSTLQTIAAQIAGSLAGLRFSREFEQEADANSVEYLSHTKFACNGAAHFFMKLEEQGDSASPPEFLSTHPSPEHRIEDINKKAQDLDCNTELSGDAGYNAMKSKLP